jgi:mitochondrial fission protein ELM1
VKIWAILGAHRGDNDQVLALAEALGLPFERKELRYNNWRHLRPKLLGASLCSLSRESRNAIAGDPPDLTVSAGIRSVPVVRELRRRSAGRTRAVHVGYPRISPSYFDLVVATPQYPIPDHPRLLRIPFALTRGRNGDLPDDGFLAAYPSPRRLLILGGPTIHWRLVQSEVVQVLNSLIDAADRQGGSVLVVGSPRTPPLMLAKVKALLGKARVPATLVPTEGRPSYGALLASADSLFVTADSVSMVSDAIATGKPVGLMPVRPSLSGRLAMAILDRLRPGRRAFPHDLRYFWERLSNDRLIGTITEPRRADATDVKHAVVERVKAVLNAGSGAFP